MKFPRTIRVDPSDTHVFEHAAEPDEWAITGTFVFAVADPAQLTGKRRQAFRNGFLGTASFGWSTLAVVAEMSADEHNATVERIADYLLAEFGAPDRAAAEAAAREETAFAASLCDHPVNTLITIERELSDEGIVENFRTVDTDGKAPARVWQVEER